MWRKGRTDAYCRRILACYLTYDPPSYRSVMMTLRICVQRHQRLPQECFVDRGPEFGSIYFETLLTRYFVTKKDRPTAHPRMGSVIERLFGTATTQLLHQLSGNTQATKHPRQMTREVDPKWLAVWTLDRFSARLCQYAYEVYDQMDHPALGQSPREEFAQGMKLAGMRTHRLIPYSEEFLILTCPTTRTQYAKLDAARGVVVNGLRYYHPLMHSARDAGKPVEVRYEPFNMGLAYAFVDGQWLTCTADAFLQVQGRTEREWELILSEWCEQQRAHHRKCVSIDSAKLAAFLEEVLTEEALLSQQQRDLEGISIREAIVGQAQTPQIEPPTNEIELDMAQFVLLGAGFDTRALRLPKERQVRSFEVDTPKTQAIKREMLSKTSIDATSITFVSADFEKEDWFTRLVDAGFDQSKPSLFLWEGVVMYLDREAVEDTLRKIGSCASGSVVAFAYFTTEVLSSQALYWRFARMSTGAVGEPLTFGIESLPPTRERLAELLQPCGLSLVEHHILGKEAGKERAWGGFALAIVS